MELIVTHRQAIKTIGFEHCSGGVLTICLFFLIQMHKQHVTVQNDFFYLSDGRD